MSKVGSRQILRYNLCVRGLFGRNRKVKYEIFALVKEVDPSAPKSAEDLMPLFRAKLAEIKFRGGRAEIREDPIAVDDYQDGDRVVSVESYVLLSGKAIYSEVKS